MKILLLNKDNDVIQCCCRPHHHDRCDVRRYPPSTCPKFSLLFAIDDADDRVQDDIR